MSEHLNECPANDPVGGIDAAPCWCNALRACQQRTLDRARDAVRNECFHDNDDEWCVFVAAIDAIRHPE